MATNLVQFTAGDFGGAGADPALVVGIGGAAVAGDVLQVTTCGIDGGGDQPTVITDNVGGAWTLLFDYTHPTEGWRTLGWTKVAVGGETTITATWPSSSNRTLVGFWAQTPSLPTLYLIDSGVMTWTGAHESFFGTGGIVANASSYVGGMSSGRSSVTNANFGNAPAIPAQSGDGTQLSGACRTIAHYNENEGAHTTADILEYIVEPMMDAYSYWLAFTDTPPPVELAGDAGLGLGGIGDLETMGGVTDLAGVGGLGLGGTGTIETTGGEAFLAGSGGLGLGARGRLVAPFPHPVPGPPDRADLLECGVYDAMVFTRGLGEIVGRLPFGQVHWERVLDGVSTANLTVDGVANRSQLQKCCALLGDVEPFEHELALYRNGYRCWSGPITAMSFPPNQILISAFDISGWLQVRTLHTNYNAVQKDLIKIWVNYVEDAMSVENSVGLHPTVLALSGILADRLTQITEHNVALDAVGELERTGIDWTTIDRVMQAGPVLGQPPAITDALEFPLLIDASFRVPPTILLDGLQGANCWFVQGGAAGAAGAVVFGEYGPAFDATPDHIARPAAPDYAAIEDQYGRIEKVVSESRALDQASIDDNAKTRYDLTKRPVAVISEGLLLPSAPIAMRKLVPGSLVQVHLANACKPIGDFYRIKSVKVDALADGSEDVNVEFQPLGTGTVL